MVQAEAKVDAAFMDGIVEVDRCRIRYAAAGEGTPVVMLHGAGGLVLTQVHQALARRYRIIAFEMPGFGHSPVNSTSQSVKDLARTMAQAIQALGIERYALIGGAFGGRVALWQTLSSPQQVDRLVLIAPTAVLPEGYTLPSTATAPTGTAGEAALLQRLKAASRDVEIEAELGRVRTLTLVVFGTADAVVPPAMGRTYRERMPNCHYVLVYDAGHAVEIERPEALADTIIDFLDLGDAFLVSRRDGRINP
jgi:pimeloyl-ACP methyl ester carboxylesterase